MIWATFLAKLLATPLCSNASDFELNDSCKIIARENHALKKVKMALENFLDFNLQIFGDFRGKISGRFGYK